MHWLGRPEAAASSRVVYRRVNLRAMAAEELLTQRFAALYPLVPLTGDGAAVAAVQKAATLFLTREKMMESRLYREIFQEGEAKGEAKGKAELLIRLLLKRTGAVAPEVRQAIHTQAQADPDVFSGWFDEAALADNLEAAQRVIRKITAV